MQSGWRWIRWKMINICFWLCIFYTQLCISQSLLLKLFTNFLIYMYFFHIFIYLHIVWNEMTLFAQWCNQNNPQQAKPCCLFLSSRVVSCNQIKVRMVWVYAMSGNIKSTNRMTCYTRTTFKMLSQRCRQGLVSMLQSTKGQFCDVGTSEVGHQKG